MLLTARRSLPTLGLLFGLLAPLGLASCGKAEAQVEPTLTLQVKAVTQQDPKGVAAASCPQGYKIIGGGCECDQALQGIFAAIPHESNAFLCACSSPPSPPSGATAHARCLKAEAEHASIEVLSPAQQDAAREAVRQRLLNAMKIQRQPAPPAQAE